jgi:hypothetical protein
MLGIVAEEEAKISVGLHRLEEAEDMAEFEIRPSLACEMVQMKPPT